jgi:hypothetical protein
LQLSASVNVFTTVAAGALACVLPQAAGQPTSAIYNGGASTLSVFCAVGDWINNTQNGSISVPTGKSATLLPHANQWIANISA